MGYSSVGTWVSVAASDAPQWQRTSSKYVCDGTADNVQIQAALDEAVSIGGVVTLSVGTFTIDAVISIPSNVWLKGCGQGTIIKNSSVAANRMLQNKTFTTTGTVGGSDSNIRVSDLKLNANGDGSLSNNHTIYMTSVDGLVIENVECINAGNFSASIYRCKNIKVVNWHAESGATGGLDGLHFWDSSNVEAVNISGETGDDVLAVSCHDFDMENIVCTNVRGVSSTASTVRVAVDSTRTGDNIKIEAVCDGSVVRGFDCGSINGTLTNCDFTILSKGTGNQGFSMSGSGTVERVNVKANIVGPATTSGGLFLVSGPTVRHCTFDVMFYDCRDGTQAVSITNANRCRIIVNGDYVNTAGKVSEQAAVWLVSGTGNDITGRIRGGAFSVQLGTSGGGGPTNTAIHDCLFDGALSATIKELGTSGTTLVYNNIFVNSPSTKVDFQGSGGGSLAWRNTGYVTENSGTATIASGASSVAITHGLSVTPTLDNIVVTLGENPTNTPGAIFVDNITSSAFAINCENDPGASGLDLAWRVLR